MHVHFCDNSFYSKTLSDKLEGGASKVSWLALRFPAHLFPAGTAVWKQIYWPLVIDDSE